LKSINGALRFLFQFKYFKYRSNIVQRNKTYFKEFPDLVKRNLCIASK